MKASARTPVISAVLAILMVLLAGCGEMDLVASAAQDELCTGPSCPDPCDDLQVGPGGNELLLLIDGISPAVQRLTDALASDPIAAMGSDRLGLQGAGVVSLAVYDDTGDVQEVGPYDLRGVGPEQVRRDADAREQQACLRDALSNLPEADGGHLLRGLRTAVSLTDSTRENTVIVAAGLGRAAGDGFVVDQSDLSTESARSDVLEQVLPVYISTLPDRTSLVWLRPGESVASTPAASGVEAFAEDYCRLLGSACTTARSLP